MTRGLPLSLVLFVLWARAATGQSVPAQGRAEASQSVVPSDDGVHIVTESPERGRSVVTLPLGGRPTAILRIGQVLYLARRGGGISMVHVGDPWHPHLVGSLAPGVLVSSLALEGTCLRVQRMLGGSLVYDLNQPLSPRLVRRTEEVRDPTPAGGDAPSRPTSEAAPRAPAVQQDDKEVPRPVRPIVRQDPPASRGRALLIIGSLSIPLAAGPITGAVLLLRESGRESGKGVVTSCGFLGCSTIDHRIIGGLYGAFGALAGIVGVGMVVGGTVMVISASRQRSSQGPIARGSSSRLRVQLDPYLSAEGAGLAVSGSF